MTDKSLSKCKILKAMFFFLFLSLFGSNILFAQNYGDVDENGTCDIVDALLVAQRYVGLPVSVFNIVNAEVSADGTVDIVDAMLIAQYYVGLIDRFPIEDQGGGKDPKAEFTVSNEQPGVNELVYFDASLSFDEDGEIVKYEWDFDDGTTGTGMRVSHAFAGLDDYTIELTVTDNRGNTDDKKHRVFFTRPEGWGEETHHKSADGNYDIVFPLDKVNRLDITITQQNYQIMENDLREVITHNILELPKPVYVPVTVEFNGHLWHHVGMRYKGKSTLVIPMQSNSHKLPLHFNFDKFEDDYPEIDDQKFYGFKELIANNNWYDSSFIRDYLATKIFLDVGVVVARCSFYEIYMDSGSGPQYWGLFTMFEDHADEMLKNNFDDTDGNLYKPEFEGADWNGYKQEAFIKKTNEDDGDFSDVKSAYDALHAPRNNPATWRANLEKVFNVEAFIRWLAINTAMPNMDSYGLVTQNYFLYQDLADNGRLVWIPWDFNLSLDHTHPMYRALSLGLDEVSRQWPLIRFLMDDPVYNDMYHREMRIALNRSFQASPLVNEVYRVQNMIRPYVQREVRGYTYLNTFQAMSFDQAQTALVNHLNARPREADTYLRNKGY